jgi:hypothetical protein
MGVQTQASPAYCPSFLTMSPTMNAHGISPRMTRHGAPLWLTVTEIALGEIGEAVDLVVPSLTEVKTMVRCDFQLSIFLAIQNS